jgi:hypothetical protein
MARLSREELRANPSVTALAPQSDFWSNNRPE